MENESGRSAASAASGHSRAEPEEVSALRASVPNAVDREIEALRTAYLALTAVSPEAQMRGLEWLIARLGWEHSKGAEAAKSVALLARKVHRRRRASAIEARRAETQGGSVRTRARCRHKRQTPNPHQDNTMTRIKTEDVVELLDCPFCASEARLTDVRNGRAVVCSNARCDASSAVFNGEYADGLAADRWNTRSATPIERLREENARIGWQAVAHSLEMWNAPDAPRLSSRTR
jgi:hypothetical protein